MKLLFSPAELLMNRLSYPIKFGVLGLLVFLAFASLMLTLAGQLNRREWQEARRIGQLLQRLPALASFIDGVGRRDTHRQRPPARTVRPDPAPDAQAERPGIESLGRRQIRQAQLLLQHAQLEGHLLQLPLHR